jgi:hypothetical protein
MRRRLYPDLRPTNFSRTSTRPLHEAGVGVEKHGSLFALLRLFVGVEFAFGPVGRAVGQVDFGSEQRFEVGLRRVSVTVEGIEAIGQDRPNGELFGEWAGRIAVGTTGSMHFGSVNPRCRPWHRQASAWRLRVPPIIHRGW